MFHIVTFLADFNSKMLCLDTNVFTDKYCLQNNSFKSNIYSNPLFSVIFERNWSYSRQASWLVTWQTNAGKHEFLKLIVNKNTRFLACLRQLL